MDESGREEGISVGRVTLGEDVEEWVAGRGELRSRCCLLGDLLNARSEAGQ
jgi:hypothetical protein